MRRLDESDEKGNPDRAQPGNLPENRRLYLPGISKDEHFLYSTQDVYLPINFSSLPSFSRVRISITALKVPRM